jgi:SAM-dependent methyltransferase
MRGGATGGVSEGATLPLRQVPVPAGYGRGLPLLPWWLKLGVRLGLAGIGLHGVRARRLGFAEPTFAARDPARLVDEPQGWVARAQAVLGRQPQTLLEIGPGRMVLRAPVLAGLGFERIWFADREDSAPREAAAYLEVAALARARGVPVPEFGACRDRGTVLARCNTTLLTGGPAVLAAIPDGSVDLVVSEVALEHVRREDLVALLAQLRRVTAPGGLGLHWIDFHDHLGGGLQHLRFSDGFWASPLVGRAGIYVNRLGLSAMVSRFRRAGFAVTVPEALVWPARPARPRRAHPEAMRPAADDLVCAAALEVRPG